jgi:hypothetical protein
MIAASLIIKISVNELLEICPTDQLGKPIIDGGAELWRWIDFIYSSQPLPKNGIR